MNHRITLATAAILWATSWVCVAQPIEQSPPDASASQPTTGAQPQRVPSSEIASETGIPNRSAATVGAAGGTPQTDAEHPSMGWTIKPVPRVLRLHLPRLGARAGVLVDTVVPGSAPANVGLMDGDILVEAGGHRVIAGAPLPDLNPAMPIVVIRRGMPQRLNTVQHGRIPIGFPHNIGAPITSANGRARAWGAAATSVSSAAGGRAVSISQAGDRISLQYEAPSVPDGPVQFNGTMAEIQQQLQQSTLPEPVRQDILRELNAQR